MLFKFIIAIVRFLCLFLYSDFYVAVFCTAFLCKYVSIYILPGKALYKCYLTALITRTQTADMVICRPEGGMPYMLLVTCQVKVAVSLVSDSVVKLE